MAMRDSLTENVAFEIPREQARKLRRLEGKEPSDIARDYLVGFYEDKRRTEIELVKKSVPWLPSVYQAIVQHVGRGGVSNYIRESIFQYMTKRKVKMSLPPVLKEGHVRSASTRRNGKIQNAQPRRRSIVVPLFIPIEWVSAINAEFSDGEKEPRVISQVAKAATQMRIEKETGVLLEVQSRMAPWLGRSQ